MSITLPTKPQVISEEGFKGTYSIENLYPGYGHTLGNSLRRIMLSSIPGVAVTTVKIDDVAHEFSTIDGVSEDVVSILLNLKKCVFRLEGVDEAEIKLTVSGDKKYTAADIVSPSEVKIISKDAHILTVTDKKAKFEVLITLKRGIGYVAKENMYEGKVPVGTIVLDSSFTPIRRASYEVENMRVGDRTDFNRILFSIETDGTLAPTEVMTQAIEIMIEQLQAMTEEA